MSPEPVNLRAVRRGRMLDELAELAANGVDVAGVLAREGGRVTKRGVSEVVTIRLREEQLNEAERLATALADSSEARAAGGQWSRSTVLRWAVDVGLKELARGAKGK